MNKFFIYTIGLASIAYPWFALFLLGWAAAALRGLRVSDIDTVGWIIFGGLPIICLGIQLIYFRKNILRIPIIANLTITICLVLITVFVSFAGNY